VLQIHSQPIADNSQPTQSSTLAPPVLRPNKTIASSTVVVSISNIVIIVLYICVISNDYVAYAVSFYQND